MTKTIANMLGLGLLSAVVYASSSSAPQTDYTSQLFKELSQSQTIASKIVDTVEPDLVEDKRMYHFHDKDSNTMIAYIDAKPYGNFGSEDMLTMDFRRFGVTIVDLGLNGIPSENKHFQDPQNLAREQKHPIGAQGLVRAYEKAYRILGL